MNLVRCFIVFVSFLIASALLPTAEAVPDETFGFHFGLEGLKKDPIDVDLGGLTEWLVDAWEQYLRAQQLRGNSFLSTAMGTRARRDVWEDIGDFFDSLFSCDEDKRKKRSAFPLSDPEPDVYMPRDPGTAPLDFYRARLLKLRQDRSADDYGSHANINHKKLFCETCEGEHCDRICKKTSVQSLRKKRCAAQYTPVKRSADGISSYCTKPDNCSQSDVSARLGCLLLHRLECMEDLCRRCTNVDCGNGVCKRLLGQAWVEEIQDKVFRARPQRHI